MSNFLLMHMQSVLPNHIPTWNVMTRKNIACIGPPETNAVKTQNSWENIVQNPVNCVESE